MNEIPPIITERVDDIPLLLEQMQRMGLPSLLDDHFPTHGNWQGLSLGWVATIWLSSILSRGDHRLVHVEPWVGNRLWTLRATTGQAVERLDFTDDRLEIVLHSLHDDTRWTAFESVLNRHPVRVSELPTARVHVDSTSASGYTTVSENGLFQFGHSKDYRPDLPQVKVMQAVLDPLGMPLAAEGDFYLCPLPAVQLAEGELDKALEAVWNGAQALSPVVRERQDGKPELIAEGYDYRVPMSLAVAGALQSWTERRMVVRSVRQAQASERALRPRVAKAMATVEALNQCGRGKKRFDSILKFFSLAI